MENCLNFQNKRLKVQEKISPEIFIVEEAKSSMNFTVKNVENPSPQRISHLKNEVRLLENMNYSHPNLISLYGYEEKPDSMTLLFEHCSCTLASYLKIEPRSFFYQICLGINYLHSKSIIHKNLSIHNVLVKESIPKISNFELASEDDLLFDQHDLLKREIFDLTDPSFQAPEVHESGHFSKKSDIWSLGVILYFILFRKNFENRVPEVPDQQFRDLFTMTLAENPNKRANIEGLLKKLQERPIRELASQSSCSCFSSRRILSSSISTTSLVQKAISSEFRNSSDQNLKRLISKSWTKPEKISKFYAELLKVSELNNDTVRLKTYLLLFVYLQNAPILAYNNTPGVIEVVNYIENTTSNISNRERNETFIRASHIFGVVILEKLFVNKSNSSIFNGKFEPNNEAMKKILKEPQIALVCDLVNYWGILMRFHEFLINNTQHKDLRRSLRIAIAEEQAHLLEFTHTQIELFHALPEFSNVLTIYSKNLAKTKKLFEEDQLAFPEISLKANSENLFEENNSFRSRNGSKRSQSSCLNLEPKFTPVDLDSENVSVKSSEIKKEIFPVKNENIERPPTVYETASNKIQLNEHSNMLIQQEIEHINIVIKDIESNQKIWQINPEDITCLKPIGNGSSCEVWLGEYQQTQVAVKKQKTSDEKASKEFYRELNVLINLRHPNLVTFLGACFQNPLCIVTEYCAGGDLFTLLHKKKDVFISWKQKLFILKEIAKGMIFLHSNNFIHRDLKSLNILLSDEMNSFNDQMRVKISDFGLSREFSEDVFMTGQLGTCHWMAPEVLNSSKYSSKADVFSFGIVMFEVITREIPYKGKSQEEIRTQVLFHGLRPDLNCVPPGCDRLLKSLMNICWDSESIRRPTFDSILGVLNKIVTE